MTRVILENNPIFDPVIEKGWRLRAADVIPADNFPLPADGPPLWFMTPAGAVDVLMPTSTAARKGLMFIINNLSANTITLKTDGDAAFTTAIVIATTETAVVFCTGSATQALGWRAFTGVI